MQRLISIVAFSLLLCGGTVTADDRVPVIAALLPLTGGAAEQGAWARRGIELAWEAESAAAPIVELRLEDTKGDPRQAIDAYKALYARHRLLAVITWGSGVGMALSPLVNRDEVVQMGVATGTPEYRSVGDFTFRNFHSTDLEAAYLASIVAGRYRDAKIAIAAINNDYGVPLAAALRSGIERSQAAAIVFHDVLHPGSADFRTEILRIKQAAPSLLFLISYPAEGAVFLKQARALGVSAPVIATGAITGGRDFLRLSGNGAEGLRISAPTVPESPQLEQFEKRFSERYREELDPTTNWYAARAYDGLQLLLHAARACKTPLAAACLRDRLFEVKKFQGISGTLSFDEAGDVDAAMRMLQILDGKAVREPLGATR